MARSAAERRQWGDPQRDWLRRTRKQAGHSQTRCAQVLETEFGVSGAGQSVVARWESGVVRQPKCADRLLEYCTRYGPSAPGHDTRTREQQQAPSGQPTRAAGLESGVPAGVAFDRLAAAVADEPLLGPMQTELARAMIRRLGDGLALTAEDRATFLDLARALRLVVS